jgi:hypothetical protein
MGSGAPKEVSSHGIEPHGSRTRPLERDRARPCQASPTFPRVARYGSKVLVDWDADDEVSSGLLMGPPLPVAPLLSAEKSKPFGMPMGIDSLGRSSTRESASDTEKIGKRVTEIRDEVLLRTIAHWLQYGSAQPMHCTCR